MALIDCNDLSIGYGSDIIQNHISFEINHGDFICVLGENGAGKTTLIKTLLGVLPSISGELNISEDIRKEGIGYLPQQSTGQRNFPTTVKEVVLSGRQNKIKLFYTKSDKQYVDNVLNKLGIYDLKNMSYSSLSGGQQQRVLLARALCVSDKLLVLDEPITGLDLKNQKMFYDLISDLNENHITIIMISHDASVLSNDDISHVLLVEKDGVKFMPMHEYRDMMSYNKECEKNG